MSLLLFSVRWGKPTLRRRASPLERRWAEMASREGAEGRRVHWLNTQGLYANALWAGHPTDANFVLVAGLDAWKSMDGGATFHQISNQNVGNYRFGRDWLNPETSPHADHHVIVSHP